MSVWRNLLAALLPWVFKTGEAAASAAVAKQDVAAAAENAAEGAANDPAVAAAAEAAATKVEGQVIKAVQGNPKPAPAPKAPPAK